MSSEPNFTQSNNRRHIGLKLLSYLLAFSFLVTLATFSFILLSDYKRGIGEYGSSIQQIQTSYQQSISYSLWNFDTRQIESQLEGILNFPGIVYVYIETQTNMIHSAGDVLARTDHRHSFPLIYKSNDKVYELGRLYIDVNYSGLYDELTDKAFQILVTQFLKTFSVSIFVLFIVRQLVTRRLKVMSDWADRFTLDRVDEELLLEAKNGEDDELDLVASAINNMRKTLKDDIVEREHNQKQLEYTKEQLAIAIDNAALGFCQYFPETDTLTCNQHFANLLATTRLEMESMSHPMEQFMAMIGGDNGAELKERLNQLLFGRIARLQACFQLNSFSNEVRYAEVTIHTTSYKENRPGEILICMVDKTKEQLASNQAETLAVNLENKVSKRTEELYEEQQRAKGSIHKLTQQLERMQAQQSSQTDTHLNQIFLKQLKNDNKQSLKQIERYLEISLTPQKQSLDLSTTIENWLRQQTQLKKIPVTPHLPLSLILEESEPLVSFLLENLIINEPLLERSQALDLHLTVHSDMAKVELIFTLMSDDQAIDNEDTLLHCELCEHIITHQMQGELSRELDDTRLKTCFSFSLIRQ